mmetsp:Transcript_11619/g.17185  ORF Transcript_11619/g.17185 Transcript_11619/m.17185 type:complete len:288 (-) Transcript_11619:2192-3055(-)
MKIDAIKKLGRQPSPKDIGLTIIYKTLDFVVVNKPFDVRMDGDYDITMEKLIQTHCKDMLKDKHKDKVDRPMAVRKIRPIHQLDYSTSGVLCYAFTKTMAANVGLCFMKRTTKKQYLAITVGHLHQQDSNPIVVKGMIGYDPTDERQFRMALLKDGQKELSGKSGRSSETHIEVLQHGYYKDIPVTKVLLTPISGRRHQLRVHLLSLNHPILGDMLYCTDPSYVQVTDDAPRMMLHAYRLTLPLDLTPNLSFVPYKFKLPAGSTTFETPDPFLTLPIQWHEKKKNVL